MEAHLDLVALLRSRARYAPHRRCYSFLDDDGCEAATLTHGELDRAAASVASSLRAAASPATMRTRNVLLAYPPGLEFVAAFFGCLYAGFVPVPVALPHRRRGGERIAVVAADCGADLVLSSDAGCRLLSAASAHAPTLGALTPLATGLDTCSPLADSPVSVRADDIAFLQYTSGSTRAPRGVCVTHGNVVANLAAIREAQCHGPDSRGVSWLPAYHDMGLIEGILAPLYGGYETTLFAHGAFLQRPVRWLQAISRRRATVSGGPNFAFDACLRRVRDEDLDALDLSNWSVAYCGAEPVRAETMHAFAARFARCGFRKSALRPVYGLAEATLLVCASRSDAQEIRVARAQMSALAEGRYAVAGEGERAQPLVACGPPASGVSVAIVEPGSQRVLSPGTIGEILVAGPSVAKGYYGEAQRSAEAFVDVEIQGDAVRWLRTGDLGCFIDGELHVVGRTKDLIIVRGRKLHPQDVEYSVQRLDPHRIAAVAAFGHDDGNAEAVVVLAEIKARTTLPPLQDASWIRLVDEMRAAVYREHDVALGLVAFVGPGVLSRTSSGKLMRYQCRKAYLEGHMAVLARYEGPTTRIHAAAEAL